MSVALYTTHDLEDRNEQVRVEKWRRWARAVRRHQRRLMAALLAELNGQTPARSAPTVNPASLPWTLEDLVRRRQSCTFTTSQYYGVTKTPDRMKRQGWYAYRPATARRSRKALGYFEVEIEAARAVLLALNPNAVIPPTPPEPTAHD